jgi:rhodanese-related sulfurtransferase
MARSIIEMIILVSIAIVLGLGINTFRTDGIPMFGQWNPSKGSIHAAGRCAPKTDEVSEDQISGLYLDSSIIFVDARSTADYEAGHIPRAISMPISEFDSKFPEFQMKVAPDQKIVAYCTGMQCHDSHDLAERLKENGYTNIRVYSRGFEGWVQAKRPYKEGKEGQ